VYPHDLMTPFFTTNFSIGLVSATKWGAVRVEVKEKERPMITEDPVHAYKDHCGLDLCFASGNLGCNFERLFSWGAGTVFKPPQSTPAWRLPATVWLREAFRRWQGFRETNGYDCMIEHSQKKNPNSSGAWSLYKLLQIWTYCWLSKGGHIK
jgi:hypothetical protein